MTFLFIHGSFESPQNAWFPWLKKQIEILGHTVIAPQFPVDSWSEVSKKPPEEYTPAQNLIKWMTVFEQVQSQLPHGEQVSIVGHSLGPVFSLIALQQFPLHISHAYYVAPFFEVYGKSQYIEKANNSFYHQTFDAALLRRIIPASTIIYSDDDPYVDEEKSIEFAQLLQSELVLLPGLGHMGSESGLKEFPELLRLIVKYTQL